MKKRKIKKLSNLPPVVQKHKKRNKTVGLITGCFDVMHIGHAALFHEAKKHVDILIVGVDNDKTIARSKGKNRPINSQLDRMHFLSAFAHIDYIFEIEDNFDYADKNESAKTHNNILDVISPHYLISNKIKDVYWERKEKQAQELGIKLISVGHKTIDSTTRIVEQLLTEL